jgi:hypothetical protein
MFCVKQQNFVNPEMSKYLKEQTNKSIARLQENYLTKNKSELESSFGTLVSNLVKSTDLDLEPEQKMPNIYFTLSFVSLLSFLAGYKFHNLIQN